MKKGYVMKTQKEEKVKHDYALGPDEKGLYKCSHCRELKTGEYMFITCLCNYCYDKSMNEMEYK